MTRAGSSPLPAKTPSRPGAPTIRRTRLADGAAPNRAGENDDMTDRLHVLVEGCDVGDALAQRALLGEEKLIGAAQRLEVVALEAATLQPADVEPGEPRPVAHHRAVGDDVVLDPGHAADHRV